MAGAELTCTKSSFVSPQKPFYGHKRRYVQVHGNKPTKKSGHPLRDNRPAYLLLPHLRRMMPRQTDGFSRPQSHLAGDVSTGALNCTQTGRCLIPLQNLYYLLSVVRFVVSRMPNCITPIIVHITNIRPACQQHLHHFRIGIVSRCPHQYRHAILIFYIGIRPACQQCLHHFRIGIVSRRQYQRRRAILIFIVNDIYNFPLISGL